MDADWRGPDDGGPSSPAGRLLPDFLGATLEVGRRLDSKAAVSIDGQTLGAIRAVGDGHTLDQELTRPRDFDRRKHVAVRCFPGTSLTAETG